MTRPSPRLVGALVAVGAVAWLVAFGVDQLAAHLLALPSGATLAQVSQLSSTDGAPQVPLPGQGPTRRPPSREALIRPIVARSIFDSASVGSTATGTVGSDGPEAKSDLDATLLATVVTLPPEFSSALISRKGSDKADGFGIGYDLWGEGTVIGIEPRRVIIERTDGSREYIAMDADAKVQHAGARTLRGPATSEADKGVEQLSDNKFAVDGSLVENALKNPEQLATQVRVSPHRGPDGQIDGYRMSGIRRDSLFQALGIKNGDIVHAVNGQPLTSMQSAMSAYDSLQNERTFSFDITRRNQRQTYEYEIR